MGWPRKILYTKGVFVSVWESHLPAVLGINRNELRYMRQNELEEGTHWVWEGKRIAYLPGGVEKIRALLKVDDEILTPAQIVAQFPPLPPPVTLLVWNPRLVNKKLILAYAPDTDPHDSKNLLRVRVRSSENFLRMVHGKPMELKARHVQADLYELATPCPRWKGRW